MVGANCDRARWKSKKAPTTACVGRRPLLRIKRISKITAAGMLTTTAAFPSSQDRLSPRRTKEPDVPPQALAARTTPAFRAVSGVGTPFVCHSTAICVHGPPLGDTDGAFIPLAGCHDPARGGELAPSPQPPVDGQEGSARRFHSTRRATARACSAKWQWSGKPMAYRRHSAPSRLKDVRHRAICGPRPLECERRGKSHPVRRG